MDVYRLSFAIVDAVPELITKDGGVVIWSNWPGEMYVGSLSGTFVG